MSAFFRFRGMALFVLSLLFCVSAYGQRQMETLGRGVVAVRSTSTQAYISWRMLGTDPTGVSFNIYRSASGGTATKLNATPITATTDYTDTTATFTVSNAYTIRPVINSVEQAASAAFTMPANTAVGQFLNIPLQIPASVTLPDGVTYTYESGDCSVGDLDGDGEYEIIVKWEANPKDNSQAGYTGNVYLDGYKMNGTRLWRIDLGKNIRAGAHYTQFMVYDFDGDGKAEIACKTAPGTIDGAGSYVGGAAKWQNSGGTRPTFTDADDYRNSSGYILTGSEFLTVFSGPTGAELATTSYVPLRGTVDNWGDGYGNRVDRFLACVAYLDGVRPSFVMCRGYYTRTALAAWDWRNGQLTQRWVFDTGDSTTGPLAGYRGQGSHSISVGDVDGDGKDEIIYGASAIDDNGQGLYTTGLGHGDALHLSDLDPDRPGLEVFMPHEGPGGNGGVGASFRDAKTGEILWTTPAQSDNGRGVAFDIDPNYPGNEVWSAAGSLTSAGGVILPGTKPSSYNFAVWWNTDLLREILDGTNISRWNYTNNSLTRLLTGYNATTSPIGSNNSTKATPSLSGDIFGDWREEVIWRKTGSASLYIFTTTNAATNRLTTLMHDPQYREAIAWQNVGYNQPPHPGFYIGPDMPLPPRSPIWNGDLTWNGSSGATWDAGTSANWLTQSGTASTFTAAKSVLFSISGTATTPISLSGALSPGQVVVHNPIGKNYTFGGTGSLNGAMTLTKAGAGSLTVNGSHPFTGATSVQQGTLIVNGALSGSAVTVEGYGTLSGSGSLGQALVVNSRGHLSPGAGGGTAGTLTVGGPVTLNSSKLDIDLSNSPVGTNDRLVVNGNLTLTGTVAIVINPLSGTLGAGNYTLATYTGTLTGSAANLSIVVPDGIPYTLSIGSGAITLSVSSTRSAGAVSWTGAVSSIWDVAQTANWRLNGSPNVFVSGDTVTFDAVGSARPAITLNSTTPVAGITFSGSTNYTISGTGAIAGTGGLTKNDASTVTLNTGNTFTGPVTINGGILAVSTIANGGQPSSLGASAASGANLIVNGATLRLTGAAATTDRGMTLNSGGGIIDTPVTFQLGGIISGTGSLTKSGFGSLILVSSNTHTGGTILQSGTLVFSSDNANNSGPGPNGVTLQGGTLRMYDNANSYNTSSWPIIVPAGASARFEADSRCTLASTLTGAGTLDFRTIYVRTDVTGNWSAFTGNLNVITDADGGDFRLMQSDGLPNAALNLAASTYTYYNVTLGGNFTYPIGSLAGSGTLAGSITASRTLTWQIGGKNLDSTFAGIIQNGTGPTALTKVGTASLTLTGANTYTGATTVSAGKLTLAGGSLTGTAVGVTSNAGFGGYGSVTGNVTFNSGSTFLAGLSSGSMDIIGNLTLGGTVNVSPLPGVTPTTGTYTLCTYTGTLAGTSFAWVDTSGTGLAASFDTSVTGQVKITLMTQLQAWRQLYFGTTTATGNAISTADPDNDGHSNIIEYATGTNPTQASGSPVQSQISNPYLQITFSRIADPMLTYTVKASDDLTTWSDIWTSTGATNSPGPVTVSDILPTTSRTRRFLRLHVSSSSP